MSGGSASGMEGRPRSARRRLRQSAWSSTGRPARTRPIGHRPPAVADFGCGASGGFESVAPGAAREERSGGWGRNALPPPGHGEAGAGVARRERNRRRAALSLGQEGRRRGRSARREPGAAHLQGDGRARRTPGGDGAADLRAQPAGGGGPGHDRVGDRDPGHHAGWALEERLDGAALRRAAPRATERRRTARAASETQRAPKTPQGLPRRAPVT